MRRLALLLIVMTAAQVAAQEPAATFEVASVRRNTSGEPFVGMRTDPGGRLTLTNMALRQLIIRAYGVQPFQVIGGPDWQTSDRFDVIAKAPEGNVAPVQLNTMLQALLADRFKLVVHRETRELPVYYLTKARADGKLGAGLRPAAVDCAAARGRAGGPPPGAGAPPGAGGAPRAGGPPPQGTAGGRAGLPPGANPGCAMMMAPGRIIVGGQPIANIGTGLANQVGRPVIDKTGLTGIYDFELTFMPEGRAGGGGPVGPLPPGVPELPPIDPNAPSLFTALQEQLGLKLEAGRGPVEVLVIDSAQQPTED